MVDIVLLRVNSIRGSVLVRILEQWDTGHAMWACQNPTQFSIRKFSFMDITRMIKTEEQSSWC